MKSESIRREMMIMKLVSYVLVDHKVHNSIL